MPYYQGDFYTGGNGYYRGDPGFLGFLGGLAKKAVGFIPGVGPALSAGMSMIHLGKKAPAVAALAAPVAAGMALAKRAGGTVARGVLKHPILSAAAGAGVVGAMTGGVVGRMTGHAAAVGGRRRKRMNVCNPRALRRSIRRTQGFAKLAMRTIHLIHPKKAVRFGGFRKARKKRVC
jgi:hypothetical protein